jgi:hypothetical protein
MTADYTRKRQCVLADHQPPIASLGITRQVVRRP